MTFSRQISNTMRQNKQEQSTVIQDNWVRIIRKQLEEYEGNMEKYKGERHIVRLVKRSRSPRENEAQRMRSLKTWEKLVRLVNKSKSPKENEVKIMRSFKAWEKLVRLVKKSKSPKANEVKRMGSFRTWEKLLNQRRMPSPWFAYHPKSASDEHVELSQEIPDKASSRRLENELRLARLFH